MVAQRGCVGLDPAAVKLEYRLGHLLQLRTNDVSALAIEGFATGLDIYI